MQNGTHGAIIPRGKYTVNFTSMLIHMNHGSSLRPKFETGTRSACPTFMTAEVWPVGAGIHEKVTELQFVQQK